jgi:predicted nucleic acid-binding protein
MKPKLYLETTIPSYLTSRPSRDLIIAGHQQITREWWNNRRDQFEIYLSQLVIDEARAGDAEAARERLNAIKAFPLLDITPEVEVLATNIMSSGILPAKAVTDAAHIAIAAVHGIEFLMTWNCVHLANAILAREVGKICRQHDYDCPVICTPEELMGENAI